MSEKMFMPENYSSTVEQSSSMAKLFADAALGGRRRELSAGEVIYEPATPADNVYYIHRGQVRLYQVGPEDARLVEILGPDVWFGVGALARTTAHESRAIAVGPTLVTEVPAEQLRAALAQQPELLLELNRQLAEKLQAARDDAARLVFEDCNQRLIRTLLHFSGSAASTRHDQEVILKITHNQLAQAVGVARETVSLALTQLRHKNLLRTGRNQLVFNPDALQQFRVRERKSANGANGAHGHGKEVEQLA
jgi:CRP/FNR family transcriptional regulator